MRMSWQTLRSVHKSPGIFRVLIRTFLQPRVAEIRSTLEARSAQIKKLRSKVDNVEDEVRGHHCSVYSGIYDSLATPAESRA